MTINRLEENNDIELPEQYDRLPTFAVGGWVRDTLRGADPNDVDLMVAEVSPSEMDSRGFHKIDSANNDTFAVFHDSLNREVAIAREEQSTGDGHNDFEVSPVGPDVPASTAVRRDLERRDFTINAMAYDLLHDVLHDPHGGVTALQDGTIRHVSDAFRDDPLRILRGARFAARLDFEIAEETLNEMEMFVHRIEDLPGERIRMELEKTFRQAETPRKFFDVLRVVDAGLEHTFPEIGALIDVPAGPEEHHSEGSAYNHTMMVLEEMNDISPNNEMALLAAVSHDLGKSVTDEKDLPNHPNHGERGVDICLNMVRRLSMSNEQKQVMKNAARYHMQVHDMDDLRESTAIDMFQRMGDPSRIIMLAMADERGREPAGEFDASSAYIRFANAAAACDEWTGERLIEEGYDPEEMGGKEFGDLLRQKRVEHMRSLSG